MAKLIGKPTSRVDGAAKVTGAAKYAAEFSAPNLAHGYLILSDVAKGRIKSIDLSQVEKQPGVVKIFTHQNVPKLAFSDPRDKDELAPEGVSFRALQTDKIHFNHQPVALVVAETFEQARWAARLVKIAYDSEAHETDLHRARVNAYFPGKETKAPPPKPRGDAEAAMKTAAVKIEAEYTIPVEHHNPIEPHASVALWEGEKLKIFDKTQYVYNVRNHLASIFGIEPANVTVISPFVGGAFGAGLRPTYQAMLAAMAARELKRPVKIVFTRKQMYSGHGYRPYTIQKVALGADNTGKLIAIIHEGVGNTSPFEDYKEDVTAVSQQMYACPNVRVDYKIAKTNLSTPFAMRAPGAVSGMFALECALDELAYALKIDPLELRLINYADKDPNNGKPFSSKALRECYQQGAEKFGWKNRKFEPRSMRDGRLLVGWGVATGRWGAFQAPATVQVILKPDGTALIQSAASDMGPGTYTTISMIAAENLGLPLEKVRFELGNSDLPQAPVHGGSLTTASVGTAVQECCQKMLKKVGELAGRETSDFASVLRAKNLDKLEETHQSTPNFGERSKYSIASHGAQFVEVKVDEDLGKIMVTRVLAMTAAGKVINPKAAHSQEVGGAIWGIGMALTEETEIDHRFGRIMNPNLQHYHVPVSGDVFDIETVFVEEDDKIVNPLGVKGMGELGMVGVPAAIANAVFHATGKRIRDLPITPAKLV
ncbi:MAG: xanthine dehydrogenase family protein molybdopterin-binding subunit [Acidobacteriota bacterium]|nr:xanthine dehydrogenase family protein molybdopterin-binding subunit [Acidobacteriota bacterium]